jgi:hypothetical protein
VRDYEAEEAAEDRERRAGATETLLRARIAELEEALRETVAAWVREANWGDGISEDHAPVLEWARSVLSSGADHANEREATS